MGRTVVVTGATSGIGQAAAEMFAEDGDTVFALGRDRDRLADLERAASGLSGSISGVAIDFAEPDGAATVLRDQFQDQEALDVLVNCHGTAKAQEIEDITTPDWDLLMRVNVHAYFLTVQVLLPWLRKSPAAAVVNVSSVAGRLRSKGLGCHYTTSKAAIIGMTRHLAGELGPEGIRVNCTCPSQTDTPMLEQAVPRERWHELTSRNPLGRIATTREQAAVIRFLASTDAGYMNGAIVDVNGGVW